MTDVVCLGILVADAIARPVERLPPRGALGLVDEISLHGGGCALNTASVLARFGLRAGAVGKVGADPLGDFLLGLLDDRGVDRRGVLRDPAARTSASIVLVDAEGERTFLHVPGASGSLRPEELDPDVVYAGRALHVAGALVLPQLDGAPTAAILAEARRAGLVTSLDTVWDATGRWERILPSLPHLDLLAPGMAEAAAISGERKPEAAAGWLRDRGAGAVALKLGAAGCYVSGEEFEGHVPAPAVTVVDGTGAGDAFAAGLLYGRLAGWPLERAAAFATAAGALATTAVGAVEGVRGLEETLALAGLTGQPPSDTGSPASADR
jgi:sugar/nucleoside kinase (ribokinase family)